ncbi:MAG: hypothetical protein IPQ07_44010 [Myxococcales bacterium]|nr:hypothetical protein [Myxococcales bacterium]
MSTHTKAANRPSEIVDAVPSTTVPISPIAITMILTERWFSSGNAAWGECT